MKVKIEMTLDVDSEFLQREYGLGPLEVRSWVQNGVKQDAYAHYTELGWLNPKLTEGYRVRLFENGSEAPMWLLGDVGTVTKVNRSRVVVEFDSESMSPVMEFGTVRPWSRAISKENLRPASWKPSDGWDGWEGQA